MSSDWFWRIGAVSCNSLKITFNRISFVLSKNCRCSPRVIFIIWAHKPEIIVFIMFLEVIQEIFGNFSKLFFLIFRTHFE